MTHVSHVHGLVGGQVFYKGGYIFVNESSDTVHNPIALAYLPLTFDHFNRTYTMGDIRWYPLQTTNGSSFYAMTFGDIAVGRCALWFVNLFTYLSTHLLRGCACLPRSTYLHSLYCSLFTQNSRYGPPSSPVPVCSFFLGGDSFVLSGWMHVERVTKARRAK